MPPHEPSDRLLSAREAAGMLGVSVETFRRRMAPHLPSVNLGPRCTRYRLSVLAAWAAEHEEAARA